MEESCFLNMKIDPEIDRRTVNINGLRVLREATAKRILHRLHPRTQLHAPCEEENWVYDTLIFKELLLCEKKLCNNIWSQHNEQTLHFHIPGSNFYLCKYFYIRKQTVCLLKNSNPDGLLKKKPFQASNYHKLVNLTHYFLNIP